MLKTIKHESSTNAIATITKQEAKSKPVLIPAQQYLDFQYGKMAVEVRLPDGTIAALVIGNQGRAFFQLENEA